MLSASNSSLGTLFLSQSPLLFACTDSLTAQITFHFMQPSSPVDSGTSPLEDLEDPSTPLLQHSAPVSDPAAPWIDLLLFIWAETL